MKLTFLKAKYETEFLISKNFIKTLNTTFNAKDKRKLGVYCAVQFREKLDEMRVMIEKEGFQTETSKPFRTALDGQILGCDSYADSLKLDLKDIQGFVYIGDGYFHPNALLLAQEFEEEIKPVILLNVVQGIVEIIDRKHIEAYLKKKKANNTKFFVSKEVGVFITTKWGQEYKEAALKLKELYSEKNFYFFVGDNFLEYEVENFPFIECWVNTACPRIGQDDIVRFKFPLVNIKDVSKK